MSRANIGYFVLGVVLAVAGNVGYSNYRHYELRSFLEANNCESLGQPTDKDAAKVLGEGFKCGNSIIGTTK